MKRAPIVLTGTAVGLAGILSYQTTSPSTALTSTSASASSASSATTTTTAAATTTSSGRKTASAAATKSGSATGQDVSYRYGDLQVKVTESGGKITSVSLVRLNATDPHSEQIDQDAIPQLEQQAVAAQSAKIDGISGASYTSQAYEQSLQSALDKLAATSSAA
jgi:uncharacterized protein with FMN-binding domain